ncbi:MAG: phosphoglycolate phosphatase [Gallionellaceae bacterium]|nr:phosphoglycolate phosphatase [Gallionellaceae bacterium]
MGFKNFPLPVSAILLDLDGTLLHSAPELAEAANRMRRDMGLAPITQDLLMSFIGNGITSLIKRSLGGRMDAEPDAALFEQAMPAFDRHYKTLLHSKPYAGVMDGLKAIKSAGYRLGCITNKAERYTSPLLSNTGLAGYFEIVVCGDTLPEKKPHPLPLQHAAQFFGVAPERVLMIGDSRNDVLAARAAGCPVFCVPYGYNHGKPVAGLDMDAEIAALPDALKLITRA